MNEKTKIVLINSPNNPTGAVYSQQTLDAMGQLLFAKEKEFGHPIYLVSDDIYRYLVFDGLTNSNAFLSYKNSILVNSHSKDLGLPGRELDILRFILKFLNVRNSAKLLFFATVFLVS